MLYILIVLKKSEIKPKIFEPKVKEKADFEILNDDEDVAEAMLLDEFEVVEEKAEEEITDLSNS